MQTSKYEMQRAQLIERARAEEEAHTIARARRDKVSKAITLACALIIVALVGVAIAEKEAFHAKLDERGYRVSSHYMAPDAQEPTEPALWSRIFGGPKRGDVVTSKVTPGG